MSLLKKGEFSVFLDIKLKKGFKWALSHKKIEIKPDLASNWALSPFSFKINASQIYCIQDKYLIYKLNMVQAWFVKYHAPQ